MKEPEAEVPSLAAAEARAMEILESEMPDHLRVATRLYALIGKVLEKAVRLYPQPQSMRVQMALLSRIANDLRCCIHLVVRGYGAQACSIAASMYEASCTVLAVSGDEMMAHDWICHSDPNRPFKPATELTRLALANDPNSQAHHYLKYQNLCLAKHMNPLHLKQRAFAFSEKGFELKSGPDTSELGIRDGWFALEHASGFAFLAAAEFVKKHLSSEGDFFSELAAIEDALISFNARALERWGSEDPLPGKWRVL